MKQSNLKFKKSININTLKEHTGKLESIMREHSSFGTNRDYTRNIIQYSMFCVHNNSECLKTKCWTFNTRKPGVEVALKEMNQGLDDVLNCMRALKIFNPNELTKFIAEYCAETIKLNDLHLDINNVPKVSTNITQLNILKSKIVKLENVMKQYSCYGTDFKEAHQLVQLSIGHVWSDGQCFLPHFWILDTRMPGSEFVIYTMNKHLDDVLCCIRKLKKKKTKKVEDFILDYCSDIIEDE